MIITRSVRFSSDPEGCGLADPAVQALPSLGGGQEALPVGHDPAVQQQQGEQEDRATGDYPDDGFISGVLSYSSFIHAATLTNLFRDLKS